jgi:hypothetical protein
VGNIILLLSCAAGVTSPPLDGFYMAIFTPAELDQQITAWKAAFFAVSRGQEYTIDGRRLRRADIADIRAQLAWLDQLKSEAAAIDSGKSSGLQTVAFRPVR